MKSILVLLVLSLGSVMAHAELDEGWQDYSGLECTMEYSQSGPLTTVTETKTRWLAVGDQMKGDAVSRHEGGGVSAAHTVGAELKDLYGFTYWEVTVYGQEASIITSFTFGLEKGLKVSLPVDARATGEEDPMSYDTLTVTCGYTVFAG